MRTLSIRPGRCLRATACGARSRVEPGLGLGRTYRRALAPHQLTDRSRGDILEPMQSAFVHGAFASTVDATTSPPRAEELLDGDDDRGQEAVGALLGLFDDPGRHRTSVRLVSTVEARMLEPDVSRLRRLRRVAPASDGARLGTRPFRREEAEDDLVRERAVDPRSASQCSFVREANARRRLDHRLIVGERLEL